ncbi:MAG: COX15/CtaA family protein [Hymenobacteraceae bacterium]|nr:COX15/CtaA family protein [Hymenobacteraceae bacterium]MDX5397577.1 COX15/CtaA family protein [Hymenobacteraceae bacterium]MDX5442227.1 COX15/CtaA family protein [Hymenobacteraceae bacterium]MDX5513657.1 COX15/CtaA family protein [Hymenobacteraceae bacterium]
MEIKSFKSKRFKNIGVLTIATVYFLILVGGIVRSTGSGMGCPDWPKCFGSWVPPTSVNQLPDDYLEVYKEKRISKNKKVAGYLSNIGFEAAADSIFSHPSAYIETEFNATKTWIEYINRLVGVLTGIFIFLTLLFSFVFWKSDKKIVLLSFLSFVIVGVEGWLGSLVVSTNLLPEMVTIHMGLALILVAVLIYTVARSQNKWFNAVDRSDASSIYFVLSIVILFSFIQIVLGTQVREQIDQIAFNLDGLYRDTWISKLGLTFYIHRSFSILILLVNLYLAYLIGKLKNSKLTKLNFWMLLLLFVEIGTGVVMSYFAIPAFLQPVHLTLSSLLFGVQFYMLITYYYGTQASRREEVYRVVNV